MPCHAAGEAAGLWCSCLWLITHVVCLIVSTYVDPVGCQLNHRLGRAEGGFCAQIINANLDLISCSLEPAADKEALEENRRIVRQLDLAASMRAWLALQGHVNSLLDSSTGNQADVAVRCLLCCTYRTL